jgi:hypothetical protein
MNRHPLLAGQQQASKKQDAQKSMREILSTFVKQRTYPQPHTSSLLTQEFRHHEIHLRKLNVGKYDQSVSVPMYGKSLFYLRTATSTRRQEDAGAGDIWYGSSPAARGGQQPSKNQDAQKSMREILSTFVKQRTYPQPATHLVRLLRFLRTFLQRGGRSAERSTALFSHEAIRS